VVGIIIGRVLAGYEGLNSRTHSWQYMEVLGGSRLAALTSPYKCFLTAQNKQFQDEA